APRRPPRRALTVLWLAAADTGARRAGPAHRDLAGDRRLRRDPSRVAATGLSVRVPGALLRDGDRQLRRPAIGAGRVDGHHRQRWPALPDDAHRADALRRWDALRDGTGPPAGQARARARPGDRGNRATRAG